ncbi:MAG: hypothetical protein H0Z32_04490 [Bacillaceae bacterium]|nr:hypothetical protein [Bacillaceae bacterium]
MKEWVGVCQICGKEIYCLNGFLDGVNDEGRLLCFSCSEKVQNQQSEGNQ